VKIKADKYGPLSMPPSAEAAAIFEVMTPDEKANFRELLRRLEEWMNEGGLNENGPVQFHREARAAFWAAAFGKIADHYRESGNDEKSLFFTSMGWMLSKYPVFAYNMAWFSIETGDLARAKSLFKAYLNGYFQILTDPVLKLISPEMTKESLEKMAESARTNIQAIEAK
jgi:hypothetical protein